MWWLRSEKALVAIDADRVRGCLLAGAIGDAMGFARENQPARALGSVPDVGVFSDDTQLTLATAQAITAELGGVRPERIADSLLAWHRREGLRGVGAATAKAIRELSVGGHWALVGRKGEMAAGNGAAIRIAPLAFVLDPRDRVARMHIRDVARITHHSDEAYVGALAVCLAIHDGATGRGSRDLRSLAAELPDTSVRDRLIELADREMSFDEAARELGNSGYVVESVPLALLAAAHADRAGLTSMVTTIVSAGGDCDSIASMAGQVWGATHGAQAIPAELLARLPERERIVDIGEELIAAIRA